MPRATASQPSSMPLSRADAPPSSAPTARRHASSIGPRLGRDYDEIEKTAQLRFDLGPDGEHVDRLIDHLHELAGLGIEVAHGGLKDVESMRPLELMAERVIPALKDS